jgi:hypothetical protein
MSIYYAPMDVDELTSRRGCSVASAKTTGAVPGHLGPRQPAQGRSLGEVFLRGRRGPSSAERVLALVRREWLAHTEERFWQMTPTSLRMRISAYTSGFGI